MKTMNTPSLKIGKIKSPYFRMLSSFFLLFTFSNSVFSQAINSERRSNLVGKLNIDQFVPNNVHTASSFIKNSIGKTYVLRDEMGPFFAFNRRGFMSMKNVFGIQSPTGYKLEIAYSSSDKFMFDTNAPKGIEFVTESFQIRSNALEGTEATSSGLKYAFDVRSGRVGYKIGLGFSPGTNNSSKIAIALDTYFKGSKSEYRNGLELISNRRSKTIDAYFNNNVIAGGSFSNRGTKTLRLGNEAGKDIPKKTKGTHVFIGKDAGKKSGFDAIAVIDYEDNANTKPITGMEYLNDNSVFVLNNNHDLTKPLLFGNFAKTEDANSMAQLAINTHHIIDSVALTVSGAVHIGPKKLDPKAFPINTSYENALLWVEKGIVTEDVTYAYTSNWKDWPDYVFEKEYDLMNLNELEAFLHKEKHLPGIVSKKEIKKHGLKSREMIANLLLKIEELTLYTIAQEKKIKKQEQQYERLLKQVNSIEKLLTGNE